jgi:PhnB protein
MKAIPYVSFNGNCEEAIKLYHSVLGGELEILRFKDIPAGEGMPPSEKWKEKVMHSSISFKGGYCLYFSDSWDESPVQAGTNCTIHLQVDSEEDVYRIVKKLSDGGAVTMPANKTFWNSVYGSFVDKFGISWGIEYEMKT